MSTSELLPGFHDSETQVPDGPLPCTLMLSRSMNADRQRLFQALTVPEFIEAWFWAPDAAGGSTEISTSYRSFHITYRQLHGVRNRFHCAYRVLRRGKIQFTWTSDTFPSTASSLVTFRLLGDFSRTNLYLTHAGLSRSAQQWYRALWEGSIEKLARLFLTFQ